MYYNYSIWIWGCDAVFNTLEKAQRFIGIDTNPVVNRTIVEYNTDTSVRHSIKNDDIVRPVSKKKIQNYRIKNL